MTPPSPLSAQQLQQAEARLDRREAELQAQVQAMKAGIAGPLESEPRDPEDAVEVSDEQVLAGLDHVQLARDQEELRDIDEARARIRSGRYGLCEECEEPIPWPRLQAVPAARFCLVHQDQWERKHGAAPSFRV
jgi:RNA polymerase-binding transcription factor